MQMIRVGSRSIVFSFPVAGWNLNVHMIMGKKFHYLIDTGLGSLSMEPVKEQLRNSIKPLVVINTHYHWDHVWGNHVFAGSMMISHPMCRTRIEEKWDTMMERNEQYMAGEVVKCYPHMVFQDTLYFVEDKIRLIYTPGHTLDSISVLDEEDGTLNAGDNVGDTLEEIVPSLEIGKEAYAHTLMRYKEMDVQAVISGHNDVFGREVFDMILGRLV